MAQRWLRTALAVALSTAVGVTACGSDGENGGAGSSGSGANSGSGSGSESTGVGGDFSGSSGSGADSGSGSSGVGGGCAGDVVKAEQSPLDLAIMLDDSGSMTELAGNGQNAPTKWAAVSSALSGFYADPSSDGIGVALQFFPLNTDSCSASNACPAGAGTCLLKTCESGLQACTSNSDCGGGDNCVDLGACASNPGILCWPAGLYCNFPFDPCVQVTNSVCSVALSCDPADYGTPSVDWGILPGHATALDTTAQAITPSGGTPTSVALQGAIDTAKARALAEPDHTVVAVLATDGVPTRCDPTDTASIAAIAAAGLAGTPSIPTFVIGVFPSNDMTAQNTVNAIAAAGGTGQAFLIDAGGNVAQDFQDALNVIRNASLACEYFVPQPPAGETINYSQVNVEHTPDGGSASTIFYVGSAANCDPTDGGWYYDVDPSQGDPTKILVCPSTCDVFKGGGQVDIQVGCATVLAPPK
jgi:hypothetical protein